MRFPSIIMLISFGVSSLHAAPPPPSSKPSAATITSDELTWLDRGAKTVFTGHVILIQDPYRLTADRMTETRATRIVTADRHVVATYMKPTGEKAIAVGDHGRYDPRLRVTDLWGHALVTHWETAVDTAPVIVSADHFVVHHTSEILEAHSSVHLSQGDFLTATADEAKLEKQNQVLNLWGPNRIQIHYKDVKGSADFQSDRAVVYLASRRAQLIDKVHGHLKKAAL